MAPGPHLNLGSGGRTDDGWVHVDREPPAGVIADLRDPLPWDTGTVEWIVAHHVLDELTRAEAQSLLNECRRVLQPNEGVMRISLADLGEADYRFVKGDRDWFPAVCRPEETTPIREVARRSITDNGARKTAMIAEGWVQLFSRAGFNQLARVSYKDTRFGGPGIVDLDDRPGESFFMEARVVE